MRIILESDWEKLQKLIDREGRVNDLDYIIKLCMKYLTETDSVGVSQPCNRAQGRIEITWHNKPKGTIIL